MAFIPLLMFCNVAPDDRNTEVVFQSEYYYLAFMLAFALSNGYVGNVNLMFGPKVVREELQEVTAAFLVSLLVVGCGVGSVISKPVVDAL